MAKELNEIKPATYRELEKLDPEEMGITLKKNQNWTKFRMFIVSSISFYSFIGKWIENS